MFSAAHVKVRRTNFEVFWYSHHLFIPFYALLIGHGMGQLFGTPAFWKWFIAPGALYAFERIIRVTRGNYKTTVVKTVTHQSKVIEIRMDKPSFRYKPGQYLFLNCPIISKHEWHPFTITSCPEEPYLSVHVRQVGDWTKALGSLLGADAKTEQTDQVRQVGLDKILRVDGPFGAASEEFVNNEIILLVGAGIGVTPFASILKSILYKLKSGATHLMKVRKVLFYWICREKEAFEWIANILKEIEWELRENLNLPDFLEINTFLTGALKPQEIVSVMYADDTVDPFTQLQSPTQYGRPNWPKIFDQVSKLYSGYEIGVFFCGPPALSKSLYKICRGFSNAATNTKFTYHKENF